MTRINRIYFFNSALLLLLIFNISCGLTKSNNINQALEEAGDNRVEIVNALRHFREQGDPEKLEAAEWIVSNMRGKSGYDSLDISPRVAMFRELTACRDHGKETVDSLAQIVRHNGERGGLRRGHDGILSFPVPRFHTDNRGNLHRRLY